MTELTFFEKFVGIRGLIGIAVAFILSVLLGLQVHKTHREHASAVAWEQKYDGEHSAFQQTIINYAVAAEKAHAADTANAARVAREGSAISTERKTSYEARIASARALAGRLQSQALAGAAHPGSPGTAGVSGVPNAPGGADGSSGKDGLSHSDALVATEQAIRLDELQKWLKSVLGIDLSGSAGSGGSSGSK